MKNGINNFRFWVSMMLVIAIITASVPVNAISQNRMLGGKLEEIPKSEIKNEKIKRASGKQLDEYNSDDRAAKVYKYIYGGNSSTQEGNVFYMLAQEVTDIEHGFGIYDKFIAKEYLYYFDKQKS